MAYAFLRSESSQEIRSSIERFDPDAISAIHNIRRVQGYPHLQDAKPDEISLNRIPRYNRCRSTEYLK